MNEAILVIHSSQSRSAWPTTVLCASNIAVYLFSLDRRSLRYFTPTAYIHCREPMLPETASFGNERFRGKRSSPKFRWAFENSRLWEDEMRDSCVSRKSPASDIKWEWSSKAISARRWQTVHMPLLNDNSGTRVRWTDCYSAAFRRDWSARATSMSAQLAGRTGLEKSNDKIEKNQIDFGSFCNS